MRDWQIPKEEENDRKDVEDGEGGVKNGEERRTDRRG